MSTWVTTFGNNIPDGAIRAGCEADGRPLFVARARIENLVTPGKAGFHLPGAHIPYGCKEHIVNQYEVLVHPTRAPGLYEWRSCSNGNIPPGAMATDRNTFIGRFHHAGSLVPGKVDTNHRCAYIGYGGQELNQKEYDVLCQIK